MHAQSLLVRWLLGSGVVAAAALGSVARANDALDFWREEQGRFGRGPRVEAPEPVRSRDSNGWDQPSSGRLRVTITPHASEGGGRMFCVRTCDGYYFPIAGSDRDRVAQTCEAACPGTAVEVFRSHSLEDPMSTAVSLKGKPYTSLPAAFSYRTSLNQTCSCRKSVQSADLATLKRDATLRSGDIVVTAVGVRIVANRSKGPLSETDFVDFRKSRHLPSALTTYLSLIDRPFRNAPANRTAMITPERPSLSRIAELTSPE